MNERFERYIQPARSPQIPVMLVFVFAGVSLIAVAIFAELLKLLFSSYFAGISVFMRQEMNLLRWLFAISLVTPILALFLYYAHKRGLRSVIGIRGAPVCKHFALGAGIVTLAIALVHFCFWLLAPLDFFYAIPERFSEDAILLPVVSVLVFSQITAEELLFRGYLSQQLAVWRQSFWVWAVVPSLLFAGLHYDVAYGFLGNLDYLIGWFIFGLTLSYATWRTGTLGYAMGAHFSLNFAHIVVLSAPFQEIRITPLILMNNFDLPTPLLMIIPITLAIIGVLRLECFEGK